MKLPSRLSVALGTLITGLLVLSGEVSMSHPLHQLVALGLGFVLWLVHPQEGSEAAVATSADVLPVEGANVKAAPPAPSSPV